MSCQRASTASATTDSSPAKPAPAISHVSANCSHYPSSQSMPSTQPTPTPRNQKHQSILALAVEAACASSRPSCAGSSKSTAPRRSRQRSGSTPHDDGISARQHQLRSLLVLVLRRQRRCSCRHVGLLRNHDQKTQNLAVQNSRCSFTLPIMPTLRAKISLAAASFHHPRV